MRSKSIYVFGLILGLTGCVSDSQKFTHAPDGSYELKVRRVTFGVNSSLAGLSSEWQVDDAIYGAAITNWNAVVETKLIEAVAAGVAKGLMSVP